MIPSILIGQFPIPNQHKSISWPFLVVLLLLSFLLCYGLYELTVIPCVARSGSSRQLHSNCHPRSEPNKFRSPRLDTRRLGIPSYYLEKPTNLFRFTTLTLTLNRIDKIFPISTPSFLPLIERARTVLISLFMRL